MPDWDNVRQVQAFIKANTETIDEILELLTKREVPPVDGEQILLWIAGMSAGVRQVSIQGDWLKAAARGWQVAVEMGE